MNERGKQYCSAAATEFRTIFGYLEVFDESKIYERAMRSAVRVRAYECLSPMEIENIAVAELRMEMVNVAKELISKKIPKDTTDDLVIIVYNKLYSSK